MNMLLATPQLVATLFFLFVLWHPARRATSHLLSPPPPAQERGEGGHVRSIETTAEKSEDSSWSTGPAPYREKREKDRERERDHLT